MWISSKYTGGKRKRSTEFFQTLGGTLGFRGSTLGFGLRISNRLLTSSIFGNGHTLSSTLCSIMCNTGSAAALNVSLSGIDFFSR